MPHYFNASRGTSRRTSQKHQSKKENGHKRPPSRIIGCNKTCGGHNGQNLKKGVPQATFHLTPNLGVIKRITGEIYLGNQYNKDNNGKHKNKLGKSQKFIVLKYFLNLPVKAK